MLARMAGMALGPTPRQTFTAAIGEVGLSDSVASRRYMKPCRVIGCWGKPLHTSLGFSAVQRRVAVGYKQ